MESNLSKLIIPENLKNYVTEEYYNIDEEYIKYLKLPVTNFNTKLIHINDYKTTKSDVSEWIDQLKSDGYNVDLRFTCDYHPLINLDKYCVTCGFECGSSRSLWIWSIIA
jgi:hypothetical protein